MIFYNDKKQTISTTIFLINLNKKCMNKFKLTAIISYK